MSCGLRERKVTMMKPRPTKIRASQVKDSSDAQTRMNAKISANGAPSNKLHDRALSADNSIKGSCTEKAECNAYAC
jgi:hypothetical protein